MCVKPAQQQRRAFYLGAMRGNRALAGIPQVQAKPDEQMSFATWHAMAWRQYLRKTATDHEKAQPSKNMLSDIEVQPT
ncbi:hypothetical protein DIPPA_14621 [Diplonema papillatum]|nr:hypothetical protein DIPPA_14621 [Diplonema papillatum]